MTQTTPTGAVHPAAELFPMMDDESFDALVDDVRQRGLIEPVWIMPDGALLDGRNRAKACKVAGVDLQWRVYTGDDPVGFVLSLNLQRRHLTAGQRAMLALNVLAIYEAEGLRRKAEGGELGGTIAGKGRPLVATDVDSDRDGAPVPHPYERGPRSRDRAAVAVGVSGRAVAQAKRIAEHAPDIAEKVKTGELELKTAEKQVRRRLTAEKEADARKITIAAVAADAEGPNWRLLNGDFRERWNELPDGSVDLIVTDPPYPAEFLPLWSDLAKHAARVLKPQGVLVALSGKTMLPDVIGRLCEHLNYGWMYCQPLPGSNSRIMGRHILQAWKPWLAFTNGPWPSGRIDWHGDMLDASHRAKSKFRWEQDGAPARLLIETLSDRGALVADPFTGTGSYGVTALQLDRRFIGCEIDSERFAIAERALRGNA